MTELMFQILIGAVLITATTALQVCFIGFMMMMTPKAKDWITRFSMFKIATVIALAGIWMIVAQLSGVWVWAFSFIWLDAFPDIEVSLYFCLSAYTTLGFGDVLPDKQWRILGALIGANGMLGFGLATASLVEFVTGIWSVSDRRWY